MAHCRLEFVTVTLKYISGVTESEPCKNHFRVLKPYAMIILGINAFHGDSSAAVLLDGKLVAAAEEERFRRVKHWAGFPSQSLSRLRDRRQRRQIPELPAKAFPADDFRGTAHNIEHHLAHLSSAFHVSPFEEAVVVSVDGFGDFASAAWGVGQR